MAKIRPGSLAAQISGSIGGDTYSHNRYGPYIRRRAIPVTSTTEYALRAKALLAGASQAWQNLTVAEQQAWKSWADVNPITDALGERQPLTGHAAYVMIARRLMESGDTLVSVPPVADAPAPLTSLTLTADIGAGDVAVTFASAPLGADERLWVWAAVVDSSGKSFVKNLLKLCVVSGKAAASPLSIEAGVTARFGSLSVGQKVVVEAQVMSSITGQVSRRLRDEALVVAT